METTIRFADGTRPPESRSRHRLFGWVTRIVLGVDRLPRGALRGLVAALLAVVSAIDVVAGLGDRGLLLYLLPVSIAAYHTSTRFGIGVSVVSAAICSAAALYEVPRSASATAWTLLNHFGIFLFVAALLIALRRAYEEEKALARRDALTGVANVRRFREAAQAELARAQRYGHPLTIALLDVDDFKRVNDTLGHEGGDAVLREIAAALRRVSRKVDVVARLGGDEFAVLLPETGADGARHAAEKFRAEIAKAMQEREGSVSVSVGAVTCLDPTLEVDQLLRRADELAYAIKRAGKDAVSCSVIEAVSASPPACGP
jgi:diguanylate cyclase (GGDEF)-like protein